MLAINGGVPLPDKYPFIHPAWAGLGVQAQVKTTGFLIRFQRFEAPPGVGGFAVNGVTLATIGCRIAAEGQTEEITAQDL